jgi:hypothetical protein
MRMHFAKIEGETGRRYPGDVVCREGGDGVRRGTRVGAVLGGKVHRLCYGKCRGKHDMRAGIFYGWRGVCDVSMMRSRCAQCFGVVRGGLKPVCTWWHCEGTWTCIDERR